MIYVDDPIWPNHGQLWAHLISDSSYEELHQFAAGLGIPVRGFDQDHYDIPESLVGAAIEAGAKKVGAKELLRILQVSGLRRPRVRRSH